MKKPVWLGIDVSALELAVAIEREGRALPLATFESDGAVHQKLIRWLTKSARPVRVCLEATGVYASTSPSRSSVAMRRVGVNI